MTFCCEYLHYTSCSNMEKFQAFKYIQHQSVKICQTLDQSVSPKRWGTADLVDTTSSLLILLAVTSTFKAMAKESHFRLSVVSIDCK